MAKKSNFSEEAHQQLIEDRKTILEFYLRFKDQVVTLQDLAVNGPNLTKCLELMTKQTAQMIEFAKIENKNNNEDDSLTFEDTEELYEEIKAKSDDDRKH